MNWILVSLITAVAALPLSGCNSRPPVHIAPSPSPLPRGWSAEFYAEHRAWEERYLKEEKEHDAFVAKARANSPFKPTKCGPEAGRNAVFSPSAPAMKYGPIPKNLEKVSDTVQVLPVSGGRLVFARSWINCLDRLNWNSDEGLTLFSLRDGRKELLDLRERTASMEWGPVSRDAVTRTIVARMIDISPAHGHDDPDHPYFFAISPDDGLSWNFSQFKVVCDSYVDGDRWSELSSPEIQADGAILFWQTAPAYCFQKKRRKGDPDQKVYHFRYLSMDHGKSWKALVPGAVEDARDVAAFKVASREREKEHIEEKWKAQEAIHAYMEKEFPGVPIVDREREMRVGLGFHASPSPSPSVASPSPRVSPSPEPEPEVSCGGRLEIDTAGGVPPVVPEKCQVKL
jgi:hypothetical protein